jgi:hypothetical protein
MKWAVAGLALFHTAAQGQELYPHAEPASNIPAGVLGLRAISEIYREGQQVRSMNALRIMYGVSPRLMVWVQPNVSNHHDKKLPGNLVGTEGGTPHTHNVLTGDPYPYLFNGFHFYGKYLFLKRDGEKRHFRMAVYGEAATNFTAHDEAEPRLADDNAGLGGGAVVTQLYKRLAVSLTAGFVKSFPYRENETELEIRYGEAMPYSLSLGLLMLPFRYRDYSQVNVNLYAEFSGKLYSGAHLLQGGLPVQVTEESVALQNGHYMEFHPGIQFIFNSNTRLDVTAGFRLLNESYTHTYPLYTVQLQHYFYLGAR